MDNNKLHQRAFAIARNLEGTVTCPPSATLSQEGTLNDAGILRNEKTSPLALGTPPFQTTSPDVIDAAFEALRSESIRSGMTLPPSSIDRVIHHRRLSPEKAVELYKRLARESLIDRRELDDLDSPDRDELSTMLSVAIPGVDHMTRHRLLSAAEERQLGRQMRAGRAVAEAIENGRLVESDEAIAILRRGKSAKSRLVLNNIRLALSIARRARTTSLSLDDLLQEALIGLMRAADLYDPDLGFRFTTYATWWLRQAVLRSVHDRDALIRIPVHRAENVARFRRIRRKLQQRNDGRPVPLKMIADELGWQETLLARIVPLADHYVVPLNSAADDDESSLLDTLVSTSPTPEEELLVRDRRATLLDAMSNFQEREIDVIKRRFGFDGPEETLEQIGQRYAVTRERIRQIESRALRKLQSPRFNYLADYLRED